MLKNEKQLAEEFIEFWSLYPRRVAKRDAENAWRKLTSEDRFAAIQSLPTHVRYWNLAGTAKEFLPYPASWLNGQRWADELEMPEASNGNDWMKTQAGIAAKATELGIMARPGEDWHSLKARCLGAMKAA